MKRKILIIFQIVLLVFVLSSCKSENNSKWLNGFVEPVSQLGIDGDIYLNRSNGDIYYKENSYWIKVSNILQHVNEVKEGELLASSTKLVDGKIVFNFGNNNENNYMLDLSDGILSIKAEKTYHNLDSIAYGGLSFKEIFLENNMIKQGNFIDDDDTTVQSGWLVNAGLPAKTPSNFGTAPNSLNVSGSGSQQLKRTLSEDDKGVLFLASQVKIVAYTSGFAGLFILSGGVNNIDGMKLGRTNGFETAAQVVDYQEGTHILCMGSGNSATLTGFVDSAVCLNLTKLFGDDLPSKKTMIDLYEIFIKMYNGEEDIMLKETYSSLISDGESEITRSAALKAFYTKMAYKAQTLGANISVNDIADPIGFDPFISIQDMVRIAAIATGYDELAQVWNKPFYTATTLGNVRTFTVSSTVVSATNSPFLTNYYYVLGGKTGTLSAVKNLLTVVEGPNGAIFVGMVSSNANDTATDNRFTKAKILFDIASAKYLDPNADTSALEASLTADRACVIVLPPNGNIMSYSRYDWFGQNSPYHLFSRNGTEKMYVASVWKILTAITALDYIDDLDERIVVDPLDISSSTPSFVGGEIMTFRNALHFMMLPSSNTSCNTVAVHIGRKIIKEGL